MSNISTYNYLKTSTLGLIAKNTALEGVDLIEAFNKIQNMSQNDLCDFCKRDDLRLVSEGRFEDTIAYNAEIDLLEEMSLDEAEIYRQVESFWGKKTREELIDTLFGPDYDDGGFGDFKEMKREIDKITSNPKQYLLQEMVELLVSRDNQLKFDGIEYDAAATMPSLNLIVAEKMETELKFYVEQYFQERMMALLSIGEHTKSILAEVVKNLEYQIEEGSFKNLDLERKIDAYDYQEGKGAFYWEFKESKDEGNDSEIPEAEEIDETLFVVNFRGRILLEKGLEFNITHGVWTKVKVDNKGRHISYKLQETYL